MQHRALPKQKPHAQPSSVAFTAKLNKEIGRAKNSSTRGKTLADKTIELQKKIIAALDAGVIGPEKCKELMAKARECDAMPGQKLRWPSEKVVNAYFSKLIEDIRAARTRGITDPMEIQNFAFRLSNAQNAKVLISHTLIQQVNQALDALDSQFAKNKDGSEGIMK